ncbi:MAG: complex I NDUFA9 subunit family protein [Bacteroidia bacterium]|nr:MAG: complex I NDUFA9 subunit family protein [Bacteroidia bacterium]
MATKVVITGANGQVGRAVTKRLLRSKADVTVIARRTWPECPAKTIVSLLDDPRAVRVIETADAVIHLAGTLLPKSSDTYYGSNVATAAAVASAARGSNVKRIIVLSTVNADETSENEYLRTKGEAERILRETRIPTVVIRSTHIIGPPQDPGPTAQALLSIDGEPVKILGNGLNIVAPVFREDVAEVLVRALENGRPGVYELCGPDRMTINELVMLLNRNPDVPMSHLPVRLAVFLSRVIPGLTPALVDFMIQGSVGNPAPLTREFGITLHALGPIWSSWVPFKDSAGPLLRARECLAELSEEP